MKSKNNLSTKSFENALSSLQQALGKAPLSELERDGVIQRFEYTFEMAWKTIRQLLVVLGRAEVSGSPKPVLRDAVEEGLLTDLDLWFDFLEARNASSHSYNNITADEVHGKAKEFAPHAAALLEKIKEKLGK